MKARRVVVDDTQLLALTRTHFNEIYKIYKSPKPRELLIFELELPEFVIIRHHIVRVRQIQFGHSLSCDRIQVLLSLLGALLQVLL